MKQNMKYIISGLVFILILCILYEWYKIGKGKESFAVNPDLTQNVLNSLNNYRFANFSELQTFIKGFYIEPIHFLTNVKSLTMYFSSMSQDSTISFNNQIWTNISPFYSVAGAGLVGAGTSNIDTCNITDIKTTFMHFSNIPIFTQAEGLVLDNMIIHGPPSYQMSFTGSSNFTMFFTIVFNSIPSININTTGELIQLFANTVSNNGLSMAFTDVEAIPLNTTSFKANIQIAYGTHIISTNVGPNKVIIPLNAAFEILLAKNNNVINLKLSSPFVGTTQTVTNPTLPTWTTLLTLNIPIEDSNMLYSNKQMVMNQYQNMTASLYNFGIYNVNLSDEQITNLLLYVYYELAKIRDFNTLQSFLNVGAIVNQITACPYSDKVCAACSNVSDWTDPTALLLATEECHGKIDSYCTSNNSSQQCNCWSAANANNPACQQYVNAFRSTGCLNPTNIDPETLNLIKAKYNLIVGPVTQSNNSCSVIQSQSQSQNQAENVLTNIPTSMTITSDQLLNMKKAGYIDPNNYTINNSYIDTYNTF